MGIQDCFDDFERAMENAHNLVIIHREHGGVQQGRRTTEVSLNRGVVAFSVAAWQAFIQDLSRALLDWMEPPAGDPALPTFRVLKVMASNMIRNYSTPGPQQTRELLQSVGFDPRDYWRWTVGRETMNPANVEERLNHWLKVRHAIAHGDAQLPDVTVLAQATNQRVLRLANAERCIRFFERLASVTTDGARAETGAP